MSKKITGSVGSLPDTEIDRRTLVKGSLAAGSALLASAVSGGGLGRRPASAAVISAVPKKWDLEVDLVSLGSSSGGVVGAIIGYDLGLSCVLVEKGDLLGGGTPRSPGAVWMPNNRFQKEAGFSDSKETALAYIRSTSFGRHDEEKLAAYLDNGPAVLEYLLTHTPLRLVGTLYGDYYTNVPDSRIGRTMQPDNEGLSKALRERAKQQPLLNKLRPMANMAGGASKPSAVTADCTPCHPSGFPQDRPAAAARPSSAVVFSAGPDEFVGGRALLGGLLAGCLDRKIPVLTNARGKRLIVENGRVIGVHAWHGGRDFYVRAKRGVLIATGGFEWNREMIKRFAPIPGPIYAFSGPGNEGDGHIMGMEVGAAVALMDCGLWTPALHTPGEPNWGMAEGLDVPFQGSGTTFGKPGEIVVNRDGRRCCDESFYAAPPKAMLAGPVDKASAFSNLPMFWVADQAWRDQFAVGPLPKGTEMRPWLHRANTVRELAGQLGMNPDTLEETIKRYNSFGKQGVDPDFGRGQDRSNEVVRAEIKRAEQKDPTVHMHAQGGLGTLEKPPFYAAKLGMGSVGTRGGLVTNAAAQVVSVRGEVIPGLYATSNAAAHLAVGASYTSGQAHSQSMVGGYLAAKHMAGKGKEQMRG